MDEIDFRMKVTRSELEEMCSDLFDRIADPVKLALEAADMTMVRNNFVSYSILHCRLNIYLFTERIQVCIVLYTQLL